MRREGNRLVAMLGSDYGERTEERLVDQVVVEHGTLPLDDLYFALKAHSVNRGEVDYRALIAGRPQAVVSNPDGRFQLFRDRRRGRQPQHPRRDLRCAAPVQGSVGLPSGGIRRRAGPLFRRD